MMSSGESGFMLNTEQLYNISFICLVLSKILFGSTHLGDLLGEGVVVALSDLMFLLSLGVLGCVAIKYRYPKKGFLLLLLAVGILSLSFIKCRATNVIVSALYLYYAGAVKNKRGFAAMIIRLYTGIIVFVVTAALFGLIGMSVKHRSSTDAVRYSLGFGHANQLAIMAFIIICMIFYRGMYKRKRGRESDYIICAVLMAITFFVTNTFSFLLLSVLLFLSLFGYDAVLSRIRLPRKQARRFVRVVLAAILIAAGCVVYYLWKNPMVLRGSLVTFRARFVLSKKYVTAYGIKPFGSRIILGNDVTIPGFNRGYYFLDNGYVRIFVENGLLVGTMAMLLVARAMINLTREGKLKLLAILLCMMLYLFNESKVLTLFFNPFWVLLREYMLPNKRPRIRTVTVTLIDG